jgi:S-adenosylmethionine:tRNA ribosyltransferase-isomerase
VQAADFEYVLPSELIAQRPANERDGSWLFVFDRATGKFDHRRFRDLLEYLKAGDVLVLNNSRVIPARLRGRNPRSNGEFEILLLEENGVNDWWVMLRPGKRGRVGTQIGLRDNRGVPCDVVGTVVGKNDEGHRRLIFSGTANIADRLEQLGEVPLPPYISREADDGFEMDRERYQTTYAKPAGSVAAPTAGLHFTEGLLEEIRSRGIRVCFVTLHVGAGTFAPVKSESLEEQRMHEERFELSEETARVINEAKRAGQRIVAVGTTTVRVLETAAAPARSSDPDESFMVEAGAGRTRLFIYPPYDFKIVDALLTNFHLPRSTLLMLVCAFASPNKTRGREMILSAYAEAVGKHYRFFSYGDAMLVI